MLDSEKEVLVKFLANALNEDKRFTQLYIKFIRVEQTLESFNELKNDLNSVFTILCENTPEYFSNTKLVKISKSPFGAVVSTNGFGIELWHTRSAIKGRYFELKTEEDIVITKAAEKQEQPKQELLVEDTVPKEEPNSSLSDMLDTLKDEATEAVVEKTTRYVCVIIDDKGNKYEIDKSNKLTAEKAGRRYIKDNSLSVSRFYMLSPAGNTQDLTV